MPVQFQEQVQSGTMQIGATQLSQQYVYEGIVNFDPTQWRVNSFAIIVGATQTYFPFVTDVVYLRTTASYGGSSITQTLSWNSGDYNQLHAGNAQKFQTYGVPGKAIRITLSYQIPKADLLVNGCTFNVQTIVSLESIVANPTNTPPSTIGSVKVIDIGVDENGGLFDFFGLKIDPKWVIVGAAALVAVLIIKPSAPAQLLGSGYREYRRSRK